MLQLPEVGPHGYGLSGDQEQTFNLQEALWKESPQSHLGLGEWDKEVDTTHVCFMANDNTPKVTFEPSLDDNELTIDKLGEGFEELSNNYDFL